MMFPPINLWSKPYQAKVVCHCFGFDHSIDGGEELARRIVAALNYCKDIKTEDIGAVKLKNDIEKMDEYTTKINKYTAAGGWEKIDFELRSDTDCEIQMKSMGYFASTRLVIDLNGSEIEIYESIEDDTYFVTICLVGSRVHEILCPDIVDLIALAKELEPLSALIKQKNNA